MRPRGLSRSSPSTWYVGHVAVQKPQCTHLRRIDSASRPSGVSRMKSASSVCIARYTFRMKMALWFVMFVAVGGLAYGLARWRRQWRERQDAEEARLASFIAQVAPAHAAVIAAPAVAVAA